MNIDQKIELIMQVGEEIINEQELRELLKTKKHPVAYDGFEPSGQIHIAQGLLRAINVNKLTSCGIKFKFWVADYFAMLNNKYDGDIDKIRIAGEYAIEIWKSCGMDMKNVEFYWASEFYQKNPQYWETVMKLAMHSTVTRVLRCSQIMGREEGTGAKAAQIMYPLMQAADIYHLEANIAQLGLDQRKVNMFARDVFPKIGLKKPVAIHHHMLLGLQFNQSELEGVDRKIAMKMSKSKPNTAIFMTDTTEDVEKKFRKAHCVDGVIEDNPVLEYAKYIVFEKQDKLDINRPEKYGGDITYNSYQEVEDAFKNSELKSLDLKTGIAAAINQLLEPTRLHFSKGKPKQLLEKLTSFTVTR
jgi:tyrosyl-tRNA synthetase